MGKTSIEWCDFTFNPWRGCTKVSAGCAHCYAEKQAKRNPGVLGVWGDDGTRVIASKSYWRQPLAWDRAAMKAGERHRVFCASMADVFEERPELAEPRYHLFDLIDTTPNLDWLLLTKRPQNIRKMWPGGCFTDEGRTIRLKHRSNVWLGTSVENQPTADERIPHLFACHELSPVLFLSMEPLLGPVAAWPGLRQYLRWAIVGGESGDGARPLNPDWARSIRDQCIAQRVPFFFKQWGHWAPWDDDNWTMPAGWDDVQWSDHRQMLNGVEMLPVGKNRAGRLLDGRTWDEMPEVTR